MSPAALRRRILRLVFVIGAPAGAVVIDRGPYLQATSATSVTIAFRFDAPAAATIEYAADGSAPAQVTRPAGRDHFVELTGLQPNTRHTYRIRSGSTILADGPDLTFTSARTHGPVRVLLFGDSGKGNAAQFALATQIEQQDVDLIAHVGDVVYPSGADEDYDPHLFQPYAGILQRTPFYPVVGNHDVFSESAWWDNFRLPENQYNESVYMYEWGDALFVALNSTALGDKQAAWMAEVLAASDKPWKFVYLHHPPYSCGETSSDTSARGKIVAHCERLGVDIVFSGHAHDYQRTYPIRAGAARDQAQDPDYVDPSGPVYIVTGGGADTRPAAADCWYTRVAAGVTHFVRMEIAYDVLRVEVVDATGSSVDRMSITKTHVPANQPPVVRLSASPTRGTAPLYVELTYASAGEYEARVRVTDVRGTSAESVVHVRVLPNQPPQGLRASAVPPPGARGRAGRCPGARARRAVAGSGNRWQPQGRPAPESRQPQRHVDAAPG